MQGLASQEFRRTFGGNIFLCHNVVDHLLQKFETDQEDRFDPFNVLSNDGLDGLAKSALARPHLDNIAKQGWSAIEGGTEQDETSSQQAARTIAKMNVGIVVNKATTTFFEQALLTEMFNDPDVVQVLLPPSTHTRRCIQKMINGTKSSVLDCQCCFAEQPTPSPNDVF